MKIGILGGTFDPIHNAHISLANAAIKDLNLDRILIMPAPMPPHKNSPDLTSMKDRLEMIRLAIKDNAKLFLSTFEIDNNDGGYSYTADTLSKLKKEYPNDDLYFIIGSDSAKSFMNWHRPDIIIDNASLAVAVRGEDKDASSVIKQLKKAFKGRIFEINMPSSDTSSTYIRNSEYGAIKGLVPDLVLSYIAKHGLYNGNNKNKCWSVEKIDDYLKDNLSEKRYKHSKRVAKTAAKMAETFNVNPNRAYLAGLSHDCAKQLDDETLLKICKDNNLPVSKTEEESPQLLHGKVGAYMARTLFGINDDEILSSITWHTTGKPGMTDLEKIIFSADYIEPGRDKQPHLDKLRNIAEKDLDLLVYNILKDTVSYLESSRNKSIDNNTFEAYNYYRNLLNKA